MHNHLPELPETNCGPEPYAITEDSRPIVPSLERIVPQSAGGNSPNTQVDEDDYIPEMFKKIIAHRPDLRLALYQALQEELRAQNE